MVSIKSIMENASRNRKYHIYILHMGIGIPAQSRVTAMADPEFEIDFVDVTDKMKSIETKLPIRDYYSNTTYFRLFIPEMFPQYRKALYVDSDTIIVGDIRSFMIISSENYMQESALTGLLHRMIYLGIMWKKYLE